MEVGAEVVEAKEEEEEKEKKEKEKEKEDNKIGVAEKMFLLLTRYHYWSDNITRGPPPAQAPEQSVNLKLSGLAERRGQAWKWLKKPKEKVNIYSVHRPSHLEYIPAI